MAFEGKTVVVTGGSEGIGFAISRAFARQGARVVMVARDAGRVALAAEVIGERAAGLALDLTLPDAPERLHEFLQQRRFTPSVLVNNAGVARFSPFSRSDAALLDLHLDLNVRAPFLLSRALLPQLQSQRGSIINISSYFARRMLDGVSSAAYSASKGAIEALTRALAAELGPAGVRVNAIAPGTVDTPLVRRNLGVQDDRAEELLGGLGNQLYPLRRIGKPDDVAGAALFLASDAAAWITGAVLQVDGGLTLY